MLSHAAAYHGLHCGANIMKIENNTVLITGGATGIGLALAERFLQAGSTVAICGRREDKLNEAQTKHPQLITRACDVADNGERVALLEWVTRELPALNVLINNAGIQQRYSLQQPLDWRQMHNEIAINFDAPVHLSTLFIPHLMQQPRAAILNVSSGLAFVPMAGTPVYCATKAALHSFTMSLRHQLAGTSIEVIEIIPPAVQTDLGGPGLHTFGAPLDEFADSIMQQITEGKLEATFGFSAQSSRASRDEIDAQFQRMNARR
jgi:uncharacterized oxidoreductase